MSTRPRAEELLPDMLDQGKLEQGWVKLSRWARQRRMGEVRCPKGHLLATCIRAVEFDSVWVLWSGAVYKIRWRADWQDELDAPAAMPVSCWSCQSPWLLDATDPSTPTRRRWRDPRRDAVRSQQHDGAKT